MIERKIPGSGQLTAEQRKAIAARSCGAADGLPGYQWHHSYVVDDTWQRIHEAPSAEVVREHARRGGFPANRVSEVKFVVGPEG